MKYIIKNCPVLSYGKGLRFKKCYRTNWKEYCKDCPDCIIKQIVELCKKQKKWESEKMESGQIIEIYNGAYDFAQEILNLLEIEEVNE